MESIAIKVKDTNNELLKELHVVKYQPVSLKGLFSSFVDDFVRSQETWDDYNTYSYQYKYNGKKFNENIVFHPIGISDNGHCDIVNDPYEFTFEYVITNPSQKVSTPYQKMIPFVDPPASGSVGFECATAGAKIYYMFSDEDSYTEYTTTWVVQNADSERVKYYAAKDGMRNSEIVDEMLIVVTPEITRESNVITITCATNGAKILYREPYGTQWIEYTGPITDSNYGYKAMAIKKDINGVRLMADSNWAEEL